MESLDVIYRRQDKPLAVSQWEVPVIEEQPWALCHLWGMGDGGEGIWKVRAMLRPYVTCDTVYLLLNPICLTSVHLSPNMSIPLINAPLFSAQRTNITTHV